MQERFQLGFRLVVQPNELHLVHDHEKQTRAVIFPALRRCFFQTGQTLPCAHWDSAAEGWSGVIADDLPAPGVTKLPRPLVTRENGNYRLGYDLLGLVYWMLSRQEEVHSTQLDHHGRFPAKASHAYQYRYLERPIIDEWLDILKQIIKKQWPTIELKQHAFQMRLSHDVDRPFQYRFTSPANILRQASGDLVKRRKPGLAGKRLYTWQSVRRGHLTKDPYNTFDWIMDVSEKNGLCSAFYFICAKTSRKYDADYELKHPIIRKLMRRIHQRGHEIGLHPSYNTYQNPKQFQREAETLQHICSTERINQPLWGGRMHYLRWEQPTTLAIWDNNGLDYDSTLGYADHPGFRCGTCYEYPAFNPLTQQMLSLRIRPLIAMECSIVSPAYLGLGYSAAAENKIRQLQDKCRLVKGQFTLLWHNSELSTPSSRAFYEGIIHSKRTN